MMDLVKAAYARHSVRHYNEKPLNAADKNALQNLITKCNKESGLHMQLVTNEPKALGCDKAVRAYFAGCVNYLVICGKGRKAEELAGYWGEHVVLYAQQRKINSCWISATYEKDFCKCTLRAGEKIIAIIALGYGVNQGDKHESKRFGDVVKNRGKLPDWFIRGVKMSLLAPTSKNQQGFTFILKPTNIVQIKNKSYSKRIDLGILKYHFEIGADAQNFEWYK